MPFDTLTVPVNPSVGLTIDTEMRVLENNFGDGFVQGAGDGINTEQNTVPMRWDLLTPEDASTLIEFFREHKGFIPFYYQLIDEDSPRKWKCKKWSRAIKDGDNRSVTANFAEDYSLDT